MSKLSTLYVSYLEAGNALSKELQARLVNGFLPDNIVAELAESHAAHYDCYFAQASNGGWRFYTGEETTSANLHETAKKQWNRTLAKYHQVAKPKQGGARKMTKADPVAKLLKAFGELSKAEQKRFLASV